MTDAAQAQSGEPTREITQIAGDLYRFQNNFHFSVFLVTPDGVPLVWALQALGVAGARRVYGPTLMHHVCREAELLDLAVGFYGGAPDVLDALVRRTAQRFPGLRICFAASPPFRELDDAESEQVCEAIAAAGVQVLFVGLGCPKQERFMARHRDRLACAMLGVGAAFDFHAGAKRQAPGWIQRIGLEWLFRLACEPRRLWRRYLLGNPRFVFHFSKQLLAHLAARPGAASAVAPVGD